MASEQVSYKKPFVWALLFHIILIVLLGFELKLSHPNAFVLKQGTAPHVISAVQVNQKDVMKTIDALKAKERAKQQAELAHQKQRVEEALKMKQEKVEKEQDLLNLKKAQAAEQKRLDSLKAAALKEERQAEIREKAQTLLKAKQLAETKAKAQEALHAKQLAETKAKAQEALKAKAAAEAREAAALQARAAAMQGEVNKYKALIIQAISAQWILPPHVAQGLSCQFEIRLAPGGDVLSVQLMRSSGDPLLDRSAQTAIYKASPLPVPNDPKAFEMFRLVSLTVKPEGVLERME